ncbi:MAG: phospholipid carrier-dependent glycosyltransferase, partial [Actinomycetota bacterium]
MSPPQSSGRNLESGPHPRNQPGVLRRPAVLLAIVSLLSLVVRGLWISTPNALIFDENYYVNAARRIAGISVPLGQAYAGFPKGLDPNVVHPPLAKVLMSFSIRLLGDNPLGWRIPSLVFGSLALLAMYWLAKAAGASRLVAVGAAGIMSLDNLFVVHGRIATLDIFVLVFMMAAAALYLRGRWGWAGILLGMGAATKL